MRRKSNGQSASERHSACRLRFMASERAIKEMVTRFRGEDQECDTEYYFDCWAGESRVCSRTDGDGNRPPGTTSVSAALNAGSLASLNGT
jgi:hypothetical protein